MTASRIFRDGLLEGQVGIVSGAGSGLGRETALELTRLGMTVVGCGRREEPLAATAEMAAAAGSKRCSATSARRTRWPRWWTARLSATAGSTCW